MKHLNVCMAILVSLIVMSTEAKAAGIPDCTTQDDCVAVLGTHEITVVRNSEIKGVIDVGSMGGGHLSASNGWLILAKSLSQTPFFYNLADGTTCSPNIMAYCTDAVVWKHPLDPAYDQAFLVCQDDNMYVQLMLSDCQTFIHHVSSWVNNPNSVAVGPDWIYVMNEGDGSVAMWDPLNDQEALTQIQNLSSGHHIRYWDNGVDPILVLFVMGNTVYSKGHLVSDNAQTVYSFPRDIESVPMAISQTHMVTADFGYEAYISPMPSTGIHVLLNVADPGRVAMTKNTAFVTDNQNPPVVKAFDTNGSPLYVVPFPEGTFDLAGIFPSDAKTCGNSLVESDEVCDGTDLGQLCDGVSCSPKSCQTEGFDLGTLACNNSCNLLDTSGCSYECGNASADGPEECDMSDLKDQTCESLGYLGGTLACNTDCTFDVNQCDACGNSRIDGNEVCDGSDLDNQTCQDHGFTGGELSCNSTCDDVVTTACTECGNGVIEEGEMCDNENLNEATCESLGFGPGTLLCSNSCSLDTSLCPPPVVEKKSGCSCSEGPSENSLSLVFFMLLLVAGWIRLKSSCKAH